MKVGVELFMLQETRKEGIILPYGRWNHSYDFESSSQPSAVAISRERTIENGQSRCHLTEKKEMTLSEYWLQINEERLHSRSKTWKCFLSGTCFYFHWGQWRNSPSLEGWAPGGGGREAVGTATGLRRSPGGGSCNNVTMNCKHDFFKYDFLQCWLNYFCLNYLLWKILVKT